MFGQLLRRLTSPCPASTVVWAQPGNRFLNSRPQAAAELPDPWRSDFVPTLPVPQGHDSSTTAFSWLRKQQPQLSLAALGKAVRQKQVRVLQQGQVKRVSRSRALTSGDVLLLPKQFLHPDGSNNSDAGAATTGGAPRGRQQQAQQQQEQQQQQRRRQPEDSFYTQQQYWQQEQQHKDAASAVRYKASERNAQQHASQHIQQQTESQPQQMPLNQQQHCWQQDLQSIHNKEHQLHQQQQDQQRQGPGGHHGLLTVPQIRRWVLASSSDIAVLLKPPGVLFGLPVAEGTPNIATGRPDLSSSSSSNGGGGCSDSTEGSNKADSSVYEPLAQAHLGLAQQPQPPHPSSAADNVPGINSGVATATTAGSDSAIFARALNIQQPQQPQLVYQLPQGASGALVLARHAAAASWLRAYVSGKPAALAAPVIAALGGVEAAQIAVRRIAKVAAAGAAGGGGAPRKKGGQGRRGGLAEQDKQVQKLQQLAAVALDTRQGGVEGQHETDTSSRRRSNSSSRVRKDALKSQIPDNRGNSGTDSTSIADPLACFDRRELLHWLQLYGEVGGLRFRRVFWAVVQGQLKAHQTGTLRDRCSSGQLCVTRYKVLASCPQGVSWVELQPLTDDTDQLRRHCAQLLGAPVLGDTRFGYQAWPTAPTSSSHRASTTGSSSSWHRASSTSSRGASVDNMPSSSNQQESSSMDAHSGQAGDLLLHAREVVLLRPSKPPVHVVAPLHRAMRSLLDSYGLK